MNTRRYLLHRFFSVLPRSVHRTLTDTNVLRKFATTCLLFLFSGRYQTWLGERQIAGAIDRWVDAKRMFDQEASDLRQSCSGTEVRVYSRGFGMHLTLKFLAPIFIPAKIGSVMAFIANGNAWFLVPLAATPILRMVVTMATWIQSRADHVRHREALAVAWIPFIGSVAYPFQMYASRPELSTFLIRDAASRIGCKLPIYGGSDSRTELAFIRFADFVVEALDIAMHFSGAATANTAPITYQMPSQAPARTALGKWLDAKARQRIEEFDSSIHETNQRGQIAA